MSTNSPRSYRWLLWTLALVGLAVDQAGKYTVFALMDDQATPNAPLSRKAELTVIPEALRFHVEYDRAADGDYRPHVNRGAFLGFGQGDADGPNGNLIFAVVSVLAAAAIIWWSTRRSIAADALLCTSLGLILGGTLGNLYDRIVFDGVRDYLYWFFLFKTAVFNIADFFLICGAGLLLIQAFCGKHASEERRPQHESNLTEMAEVK